MSDSKYQEALDRLCENNYFDEKGNCNCELIVMDRILLQELVDKATPKNPILVTHGKVKMTAKEMFEELGWKKVYESQCSIIYERGFRTCSFIKKNEKEVAVDSSGHISMNMLKAINQQCKELGWI